MDAKQILSQLSTDDIVNLLSHLGSELSDRSNDEYLIFHTNVCHGGDSYKLYYYKESKSFFCYSGCGKIRDIFELVMMNLNMSFEESLKYIINHFGLSKRVPKRGFPKKNTYTQNNTIEEVETVRLPPIDKQYIHYAFNDVPVYQWLKDNISEQAMSIFDIRYSIKGESAIIPHRNTLSEVVGVRVRAFNQEEIENYGKYHPLYYGGNGYAHPLGRNLYGIHKTQHAIKKHKKVVIGESEKFVLQFETYYNENNISVALCGSSFSKYQMKMLLDLGVEEFILAFDKDYTTEEDELAYFKKIYKKVRPLLDMNVKVTIIWDEVDGLLGYKDSPTDKGKLIYERLVRDRKNIREIANEKI